MRFSRQAEAVVLVRHFPKDFVSLHGYAFGERNGVTQNESGYYVGLTLQPNSAWRVAAYIDQYQFPWVRFGVPGPSTGFDTLLMIEHRPSRFFTIYLQGRSETKETGTKLTDNRGRVLDALLPQTRQSLRLHTDYWVNRTLRLRSRVELIRFFTRDTPDERGLVVYQDVRWNATRTLRFDLRLGYFNTDSFDARVYTYENDLLYTFSVPSFSGRGQRAYVLARWDLLPGVTFQAKASITRFEDVETVGSGLDEVEGNQLREVRALLRVRL